MQDNDGWYGGMSKLQLICITYFQHVKNEDVRFKYRFTEEKPCTRLLSLSKLQQVFYAPLQLAFDTEIQFIVQCIQCHNHKVIPPF